MDGAAARPADGHPPCPAPGGATGPPRVVVVDDSAVQRRFARAALEAGDAFEVVGEAHDGREAVALVSRLRPAAVLMDLDLPVMSGLEAIEQIMASCPTAILVFSGFVEGDRSDNALAALAAGAVDVLAKPSADGGLSLPEQAEGLRRRLRTVARVRVITHPRSRLQRQGLGGTCGEALAPLPAARPAPPGPQGVRQLVLGASTGGPQALRTVLAGLPADLEQAVLVVQHMAEAFVPGLADWLDGLVPLPVVVGASGRRLLPGTVTIAPGGTNLLVQDDRLRVLCVPAAAGQFHVPGIDATLSSVAAALGPASVGVVLTGMGRDGAAGLLAMRERGAATIGQDEASSAVYGMPAAAHAVGAVDVQLPVDEIAPALLALLGRVAGAPA